MNNKAPETRFRKLPKGSSSQIYLDFSSSSKSFKLISERNKPHLQTEYKRPTRPNQMIKSDIYGNYVSDRKLNKYNKYTQNTQIIQEERSWSISKKQLLENKRHQIKKSTITDLKKYVDLLQKLSKSSQEDRNNSPTKIKQNTYTSKIKSQSSTMSSELKSSVSTLQTPGRKDKYHSFTFKQNINTLKQMKRSDFQFIRKIGNGKFSEVFLVCDNRNSFISALKIIKKSQINSQKMVNQFSRQLKIHSFVKHPNIINLYNFFSDKENVYLLQQYGNNGQLYKKMKQVGRFSEKAVSFIVRNLLEAIRYLHSQNIIHRDIKPQNIVLVHGHVKICDFGWAVYQPNRFRETLCGTPLYSSPQLVKGEKYSNKIDLWTIGTLAYQLFYGQVPFVIQQQDDFIKITTEEVKFLPNFKISEQLQDFINQLLKKDPRERLTADIMLLHPFIQAYSKVQVCQQLC